MFNLAPSPQKRHHSQPKQLINARINFINPCLEILMEQRRIKKKKVNKNKIEKAISHFAQ